MSNAPRYLGKAGSALALERLSQYRRYADLVASQESALDTEDLDRFHELGQELLAIREEIGPVDPDVFGPEQYEVAREAAAVLQETIEAAERVRSRLSTLRKAGAEDIRKITLRRPQARRYVAEGSEETPRSSKLDVTL